MFACCHYYFRLPSSLISIHTTCISLSLRRTSVLIHLTSVLGALGTQETFCILIAGLLERDIFDLYLPEFDKPWVIHSREACCCPTNLCAWRLNIVYKNRSVRRHHTACHISNKVYLHKFLKKTLHDLITGDKPNVSYFRVFGAPCFIRDMNHSSKFA